MKNRAWIVLLLVSLGVNAGLLLHWFWPRIAGAKSAAIASGWHAGPMKHHLGLSSDQARRMESERLQLLTRVQPLQDELRLKRRELFVLLKGNAVTDAELDVALSEISRMQAAIEKLFIVHSLKVKGFFTPAQLRKYEVFFERGLCPGMGTAASCPPGTMPGRGTGRPGCDNMRDENK